MATDITKKFASAVKKALSPGELVKDDHFTLFESVAALEVMDPKMDSGVLAEGESLDQEYDVSRDLLPEEILGIIDQLLCLEMAWHLGYPLSQTLFTSVYIESLMKPRPTNIDEAEFIRDSQSREKQPKFLFVLRAYCVGLLKACCFVNELVKEELYYEEEDFVTNTYDRNLLFDIPLASINSLLLKARSDLRLISNEVPKEVSAALELRLELRIAFLRAIDLASLRRNNPDSLKMPWTQMSGLIEHIKRQHELGKPVPEAFSTKLQRRLASTMPPRPMVQPSFEESYGHFKRLFQDGVDIMDVLKYTEPQSLLEWEMLQGDVEEIDQLLQNALDERPLAITGADVNFSLPLSSWAYLYKLRQMEWIVQLGFELEIYQTDELAGMYWYLNYLAKTRAQHGDRIKSFTMRSLNEARYGLTGSGEQQLPQYTSVKDREYMTSLAYLRVTMLDAACTWEFADGLCCLYTALLRLNLIALPQRPYSSDTLRYDLRMKPFRSISLPALPTFDEFTRATLQPETTTYDLLKYAENAVGGARKGYEALSRMPEASTFSANTHDRWVGNIKDCLRAAIAAGVAVSTLQQALRRVGSQEDQGPLELGLKVEMPEMGKGYHDWWIVPKLVPTRQHWSTEISQQLEKKVGISGKDYDH
ncbi:hypothetical protein ABKA04_002407 [Annulohypoxylon sp. FPYF3050]